MAQSYFVRGEAEQGIGAALAFGELELGLSGTNNPDIIALRFGLFSVDDARRLTDMAYRSASGDNGKLIVASATRLFHEAQNALLKLFEEPPAGVTLVLVVPTDGILLPTLRSRLLLLPNAIPTEQSVTPFVKEFLDAGADGRESIVAKLLERAKSDKDEVKQAARSEALSILEGLAKAGQATLHRSGNRTEQQELVAFLEDVSSFVPILHERSAPLKLIFEHLLLVIPKRLAF